VDIVSELHTRAPSASKLMKCGQRTVCVQPYCVINLCVTDTAIRQAYYYAANILARVRMTGRLWRDMDVLLGERTTGGCMWPGHRVLSYYLTNASSTGNEDLDKRFLHVTGICSQQYCLFLWQ